MNRKERKMLEDNLKRHISTYNDIENLDIIYYWEPMMPPLKQSFIRWYEINNKGEWRN